jgi:NAD(P)-dependent dehydrogenase (short-subunit alcohol dehydrogenase family)
LVHLAGGYKAGNSITDYSNDDFTFLMDLNTRPTFLLLKHLLPKFKAQQAGSIVTIGAKPALHAVAANAVYTASKSAVIALTMAAAEEGRNVNVRANCIVPAALQTPGNLSWASKEQFNTFTPLDDVADTILFLMSDQSRGVTGTIIPMYNKIPT